VDPTPVPAEDPALRPVRVLVEQHLADPDSAWSSGAPGAAARFARDADEPVQRGPNSVVTPRGGLRVVLPDDAVAIAYETPSARDPLAWHQTVAFCVPVAEGRRAGRTAVTEVGPDLEALRPRDTGGVLFDLGLGLPHADVLVRTADAGALAALRSAEGRDALHPDTGLGEVLAREGMHVVVLTAAGRLEVLAASDRANGPRLRLRADRRADADLGHLPIPAGWTPVLRLHPAHPATGPDGHPAAFDADRFTAFQTLLAEHGDPVLGVHAAEVAAAVRAGRDPASVTLPDDPATRAAVGVVLRRLAITDGTTATLALWRSRYGPDPALADPVEP
jgi:hypothetical protein